MIMAKRYREGIFNKLIDLQIVKWSRNRFHLLQIRNEHGMGLKSIIRDNFQHPQSINEGFSNFLWRGYEYSLIKKYVDTLCANTCSMNLAICFGFQAWYSLLPSFMLSLGFNDINELLSPDVLKSFKDSIRGWTPQLIKYATEMCENIKMEIMQAAGGASGCSISSETGTFDPLGIRGGEGGQLSAVETSHKTQLRQLVIACFALCLLSNISYISACGTELCQQFYEGHE